MTISTTTGRYLVKNIVELFIWITHQTMLMQKKEQATTTGNERTKLSAAFSSTASGPRLPMLLIVPRKN